MAFLAPAKRVERRQVFASMVEGLTELKMGSRLA